MRKSTKCPWCKNKMVEINDHTIDYHDVDYVAYKTIFRLGCGICNSHGPRYVKNHLGGKTYLPSKNGI